MTNLLKWILFPGVHVVCRFGGDDGDGGGGLGSNFEAEEARKGALRKRIDRMYGIDADRGPAPERKTFTTQRAGEPPEGWHLVGGEGSENMWTGPSGRVSYGPPPASTVDVVDEDAYNKAVADFNALDKETVDARTAMEGENTKLANATRSYYTDQLGREYNKAERETRFKLARQGLMGGSEDIYQQGDVRSDRDLGATRVDEAVRRAVGQMKTQREQERLNAVQLVNSGAGDSAVSAAQAGLKNTFENANAAQKVSLFDDLFTNAADAFSANNLNAQQQLLAERYYRQLGAFPFQQIRTTSGKTTPDR